MLIVLPILSFILYFLNIYAYNLQIESEDSDWQKSFLQTSLLWGVWIALISEGLGLFNALTTLGVALTWTLFLITGLVWGLRTGLMVRGWQNIRNGMRFQFSRVEIAFSMGLILLLGVLFLVAWFVPPNNTDSMNYHMARVMHWAENQNLNHYTTAFEPQLYNPIWAEEAILHFRLLWGNDQLANLVQWFSLISSLVGISGLARLFGAGRKGQMAAIAFGVTLPMAVLQSTSTQNDLVNAFWLVCLAYFCALASHRSLNNLEWASLSAALGLGLLTKGTFYPFALPFGIWFFVARLLREHPRKWLGKAVLLWIFVILLNAGYWMRNIQTYGGPFGSEHWVENRVSESYGVKQLAAGLVRNTVLHFTTPSEEVNHRILLWVQSILNLLKQNPSYRMAWGWNHEDVTGAPIHITLLLLSCLFLAIRPRSSRLLGYLLTTLASYAVFSLVINFDLYGIRYQLPFFMAGAPLFGLFMERISQGKFVPAMAFLLLLTTIPYLLFNRTKPIIALRDSTDPYTLPCLPALGCTSIGSILNEPASSILFANWTPLRDSYTAVSQTVKESGCKEVGLRIDSSDKEYYFWWLIGAPQNGIHMEAMLYDERLSQYTDTDFTPCGIICTVCGDKTQIYGLDLIAAFDNVRWYMGDHYTPLIDQ